MFLRTLRCGVLPPLKKVWQKCLPQNKNDGSTHISPREGSRPASFAGAFLRMILGQAVLQQARCPARKCAAQEMPAGDIRGHSLCEGHGGRGGPLLLAARCGKQAPVGHDAALAYCTIHGGNKLWELHNAFCGLCAKSHSLCETCAGDVVLCYHSVKQYALFLRGTAWLPAVRSTKGRGPACCGGESGGGKPAAIPQRKNG